MSTIQELTKRGARHVVLRCFIKRVQTSGAYESDWFNISEYVEKWGKIRKSYKDVAAWGVFDIKPTIITLNNRKRRFNPESEFTSLFYGFLTRHKTKFKIELSFVDDDYVTEVTGLTWYGIMYSKPFGDDTGQIRFTVAPLINVFNTLPLSRVTLATDTTGNLIDDICTVTINGARYFDQFIEGADDATKYQINPDGDSLQTIATPYTRDTGRKCWDLIKDYSKIESFMGYINSSGNFVWTNKDETAAEQWKFNGGSYLDNDYGINIERITMDNPGTDDVYTYVSIGYWNYTNNAFDYQNYESSFTPGDGSFQDIYGEITYSTIIPDLTSAQAQTVAQNIYNNVFTPKRKVGIRTPIIPQLEIKDKVEVNFRGQSEYPNPFIVGISELGGNDVLSGFLGSIKLIGFTGKIIDIEHDLDNLKSDFIVREV